MDKENKVNHWDDFATFGKGFENTFLSKSIRLYFFYVFVSDYQISGKKKKKKNFKVN